MRLFRGDLWEVFEPEDVGEAEEGEPRRDDHKPLAGIGRPEKLDKLKAEFKGENIEQLKMELGGDDHLNREVNWSK